MKGKENKQVIIQEDGIPVGNIEQKYSTKNFLAKYLVNGFLRSVEKLVRKVSPSDIHEVGCGEGLLTINLAQKFPECSFHGSDFSTQIVSIAKQNKRQKAKDLPISFGVKNIYELNPYEDSAALVICCEVLEHLSNPEQALQQLVKVTNKFIILSVPREPLWRFLNIVRGKYWRDYGNTPGHIQHWSKKNFLELLSKYFDIIEVSSPIPWTIVLCQRRK